MANGVYKKILSAPGFFDYLRCWHFYVQLFDFRTPWNENIATINQKMAVMGKINGKKPLTEMQQFTIDLLKKQGREIHAGYLANEWAIHKTGRCPCSSRDRFGFTSSAYRALRSLEKIGRVISIHHGTQYRSTSFKLADE